MNAPKFHKRLEALPQCGPQTTPLAQPTRGSQYASLISSLAIFAPRTAVNVNNASLLLLSENHKYVSRRTPARLIIFTHLAVSRATRSVSLWLTGLAEVRKFMFGSFVCVCVLDQEVDGKSLGWMRSGAAETESCCELVGS